MKRNRCYKAPRSGTIIVCVLTCLAICTALGALSIQSALQGRREVRLQRQLRQTELLCEAGVLRAMQQAACSDDYRVEQWRPELNNEPYFDAQVDIKVSTQDDSTTRAITVVARLDSSSDADGPMQRSHTFTYIATAPQNTENQ